MTGWDLVEAPFSDVGWYAEHLASFGRAVIAVEPADLREAVITQLKGATGVTSLAPSASYWLGRGCSGCWRWCPT